MRFGFSQINLNPNIRQVSFILRLSINSIIESKTLMSVFPYLGLAHVRRPCITSQQFPARADHCQCLQVPWVIPSMALGAFDVDTNASLFQTGLCLLNMHRRPGILPNKKTLNFPNDPQPRFILAICLSKIWSIFQRGCCRMFRFYISKFPNNLTESGERWETHITFNCGWSAALAAISVWVIKSAESPTYVWPGDLCISNLIMQNVMTVFFFLSLAIAYSFCLCPLLPTHIPILAVGSPRYQPQCPSSVLEKVTTWTSNALWWRLTYSKIQISVRLRYKDCCAHRLRELYSKMLSDKRCTCSYTYLPISACKLHWCMLIFFGLQPTLWDSSATPFFRMSAHY